MRGLIWRKWRGVQSLSFRTHHVIPNPSCHSEPTMSFRTRHVIPNECEDVSEAN